MVPVAIMNQIEVLKASLANAPIIWKGDYPYFIHPITDGVPRLNPNVLEAITDLAVGLIDWESVDLILGIEAMGLPLVAPVSLKTKIPMVVARKRQYELEGEITIDQTTGYSKGSMYLNDLKKGEKIAIIDDVLSTGGTIKSVIDGIVNSGSIVTNVLIVVEKGPGLEMLKKQYPEIQFDSLIKLEMQGEKIILLD